MDYYAGIDVSLKESSICVVDGTGKVVREVKVASEPEALVVYFGTVTVWRRMAEGKFGTDRQLTQESQSR